jgi:four helix bundle protein
MNKDLGDRLFEFAVSVIKCLRKIENSTEASVIKYQLTKSSTSSGANYEEAQAASSRADFKNKINISLREIRESNYWLGIMKRIEIGEIEMRDFLINESDELKKILGSIASKITEKK